VDPTQSLIAACCALALLTFVVGFRMLIVRIGEMRRRGIEPQDVALSGQRAERLEDTRASDNYNHLFELPVLFYALAGLALATGHVLGWLAYAAWLFVVLRVLHSLIQCTYNRVLHRFTVFLAGYGLLLVMWLAFGMSYLTA
jgi:hypothetical protein